MKKKMTIRVFIEATIFAGFILSPIGLVVGLIFGWRVGLIIWLILMFTNMFSALKQFNRL